MRDEISRYIQKSDLSILCRLEEGFVGRIRIGENPENDLGSDIIEKLLDEVETADYSRLKEIHTILKSQGLIK